MTRYSFDPWIANANFLLTSFNYTGNKMKMKKYNITGQKDTQKKKKKNRKKGKWQMFIVKEKKIQAFLSV